MGGENIDMIEKLYIRYCKYVLHLPGTGRVPMILKMKIRVLRYWNKLRDPFISKLNCKLYKFLYQLHHEGLFSSPWLLYNIGKLLKDIEFRNI